MAQPSWFSRWSQRLLKEPPFSVGRIRSSSHAAEVHLHLASLTKSVKMPTATSTSQFAITNVGPLTTVFATPTSCATAQPELYLAISGAWGSDRVAAYYKQNCDVSKLGECFPSGKELDDALSAASTKANNDRATIAYFSPASQCPDSYTTAGSAHRGSDGNVTSSGVFVPPVVTSGLRSGGLIGYNPPLNVLMEVLDEDEIAIVCCPE